MSGRASEKIALSLQKTNYTDGHHTGHSDGRVHDMERHSFVNQVFVF